jgi:hypothetical protein
VKEHEDRILDYALARHFRGEETVDLSEEIARAWDEGARGSLAPDELELEDALEAPATPVTPATPARAPEPASPIARRPLLRLVPLAAAAAAVAAALFLFGEEDAPEVRSLVAASRAVGVLDGAGTEHRSDALAAGESALLLEGEATFVVGSAQLAVRSPALLRFQHAGLVDLLVGAVELTAGTDPMRLETGFAALHVDPGSRVVVELTRGPSEDGSPPELDVALARRALASGIASPRSLRVTVAAGEAELVRSAGRSELLDPESGSFVVPSRAPEAVSDEDIARFEGLLERLVHDLEAGPTWDRVRSQAFARGLEQLGDLLTEEEELRALFRQRVLEKRRDGALPPFFTTTLLDFLELDPDPAAFDLARRLWIEEPSAFFPYHVVAFAERGGFEFERELDAMVESWNEDPESWELPPLVPAVHLAFREDARARPLLTAMVAERPRPGYTKGWEVADQILAAVGLDALGDTDVWDDVLDGLAHDVEMLVEQGETIEAARIVLTLEVIVARLRASGVPELTGLGLALRVVPLKAEDPGDPGDLLVRLEEARNG